MVTDIEAESITGLPRDERARLGTERSAGPVLAWFEARALVGGAMPKVNFVRRAAAERHVRVMLVIPIHKGHKL